MTMACPHLGCSSQEGDVVIMDVDPDGSIAVLAGDKKMRTAIDATPAGIA
jgi:ATP-dependent Clp protease ATP-binding subunit ClpC